jgi:hypothetical protein
VNVGTAFITRRVGLSVHVDLVQGVAHPLGTARQVAIFGFRRRGVTALVVSVDAVVVRRRHEVHGSGLLRYGPDCPLDRVLALLLERAPLGASIAGVYQRRCVVGVRVAVGVVLGFVVGEHFALADGTNTPVLRQPWVYALRMVY